MLRTRLISAAVLIPSVALCAYLGGLYWFGVGLLVCVLATREFLHLVERDATSPQGPARPSKVLGLALSALLLADGQWPGLGIASWGLVLTVLAPLAAQVWRSNAPGSLNGWALTCAGACYVGYALGFYMRLRQLDSGLGWVLVALGGTWLGDTAAYLVGRNLGRRPFFPEISPRKTVEGAIGELVLGPPAVMLLCMLFRVPIRSGQSLLLGLAISLAAIIGDLAESVIKRQLGAKDSARLIPGHGGMLDRIDSLLYVGPVVFYFVTAVLY